MHAYPPERVGAPGASVELTMCLEQTEVVVTVADHGRWVAPDTTALEHDSADHPAQHGRGIILMNTHVDEVAIRHDREGTTVMLRSTLTRAAPG